MKEGRGGDSGIPAAGTATLLYALVVRRRRANEALLCSMRLPFPSTPLAWGNCAGFSCLFYCRRRLVDVD